MEKNYLLSETTFTGFAFSEAYGAYAYGFSPSPFALAIGETYTVEWDGVSYTCTAADASAMIPGFIVLGNFAPLMGGASTGEPFIVGYAEVGASGQCELNFLAFDNKTEHTVAIYQGTASTEEEKQYLIRESSLTNIADAIREKTGRSGKLSVDLMPTAIRGITGGGTDADVVYITFMSHDGATELYKKPVVVGDDSCDPVTNHLMETPARESTAQYHFTFAGWATTANGGLDANALKAVTADRTVYANYIATVRSYAVRFFDGDTQIGSTQYVAYGANATPPEVTKDGYKLDGWQPAYTHISADTDCYAQWNEAITFGNGTWEEIAEICEAGEAANTFAVGDTKIIPVTIDGVVYPHIFKIVGIHHDDLADGSGKASLSILSFTMHITAQWATYSSSSMGPFYCLAQTAVTNFKGYLPTDLQSIIKTVKKTTNTWSSGSSYTKTRTANLDTWYPTSTELLGVDIGVKGGEQYAAFLSEAFGQGANAIYDTNGDRLIEASGWLCNEGDSKPLWSVKAGSTSKATTASANIYRYVAVGFCI